MFLIVFLYALLAGSFTVAKHALDYGQPIFLVAFRMLIAGVLLLTYCFFAHKNDSVLPKKKDYWLFAKLSLFYIYLAYIPEFWALQYLSSAKTNVIYSATPFISAFLAYFLLQEKLTFKKIIGMCVGVIGLLPIVILQTGADGGASELLNVSLPEFVLLGAVFSAAYGWFLVKQSSDKGYGLLQTNGIAMFCGGVLAAITSLVAEVWMPYLSGQPIVLVNNWIPFIGWVALLVVMANLILYNLYGWLIRQYSITFVSFAGFMCPLFGALFGWFFLGEQITWHYFVSFALIFVALFIFYQEELRSKKL